jgi:hypothetical protein
MKRTGAASKIIAQSLKFKTRVWNSKFQVASSKFKTDSVHVGSHSRSVERRAFNFELATWNLKLLNRHVEREAAGAGAGAGLREAKVCELDDPAARVVSADARDGKSREVE